MTRPQNTSRNCLLHPHTTFPAHIQMNSKEQLVLLGCLLLRLGISSLLPTLSKSLETSVQLSTLITSHRSLLEGIFLQEHSLDVYDGGLVHQSPLFVALMASLQPYFGLIYPLIDVMITFTLIRLAKVLKLSISPWIVGASYAFNPIAVLSNQAKSGIIFANASILDSLLCATEGSVVLSAIWIAIASYLNYTPLFLIVPLTKVVSKKGNILSFLTVFILSIGVLLGSSYLLTGDWKFLHATYGTIITFGKIAPNMGLWWYFFTEMFEFFIPFYTAVFSLYNISFIIPITIKLEGVYAFIMCIGWLNFGKPYPELTDLPVYLSLLLLLQPYFKYLVNDLIYALLFLHSIILAPIFYHLWIDLGSGNSNFFYAITLVYSLAMATTIGDFIWAYMQKSYHDENNLEQNVKLSQI